MKLYKDSKIKTENNDDSESYLNRFYFEHRIFHFVPKDPGDPRISQIIQFPNEKSIQNSGTFQYIPVKSLVIPYGKIVIIITQAVNFFEGDKKNKLTFEIEEINEKFEIVRNCKSPLHLQSSSPTYILSDETKSKDSEKSNEDSDDYYNKTTITDDKFRYFNNDSRKENGVNQRSSPSLNKNSTSIDIKQESDQSESLEIKPISLPSINHLTNSIDSTKRPPYHFDQVSNNIQQDSFDNIYKDFSYFSNNNNSNNNNNNNNNDNNGDSNINNNNNNDNNNIDIDKYIYIYHIYHWYEYISLKFHFLKLHVHLMQHDNM